VVAVPTTKHHREPGVCRFGGRISSTPNRPNSGESIWLCSEPK